MSEGNPRIEMYNLIKSFVDCKMSEGSSVTAHMIKMMTYVNELEKLGCTVNKRFSAIIVLDSLAPSYSQFIMKYNMCIAEEKSLEERCLGELCGLLRTVESSMKNGASRPHMVNERGKKIKKRCKTKAKGKRNV